jgi:hypothetical protein
MNNISDNKKWNFMFVLFFYFRYSEMLAEYVTLAGKNIKKSIISF